MNNTLYNPQLEGGPFFREGGPTGVLLLHGFTATTAEVRPLAERLHQAGYTVAGPLLPGHGTSPEDLNKTPWQAWPRAAEESYRQLAARCRRVFVGGESMGGVTALYLASQIPEIAGVIGYAPAIKLAMRFVDYLKFYAILPFVKAMPKGVLDDVPGWQGYRVNPLRGVFQLQKLQKATRRRLPHIHQPIMILQGRLDTVIHPRSGTIILRDVNSTHQELHWLPNSPHVVTLGPDFEELLTLTLNFISKDEG